MASSTAGPTPRSRAGADRREEALPEPGELIQIPVYISAIAVIYNLPEVPDLQLSPDTIAGIFDQEITTWNDPKIAADNPDASLPDKAITPVNRSDDSGTTANFTDYLSQTRAECVDLPAR